MNPVVLLPERRWAAVVWQGAGNVRTIVITVIDVRVCVCVPAPCACHPREAHHAARCFLLPVILSGEPEAESCRSWNKRNEILRVLVVSQLHAQDGVRRRQHLPPAPEIYLFMAMTARRPRKRKACGRAR